MSAPPRHRHEMTLHLGANTIDDLCREMEMIALRLQIEDRDEPQEMISSAGWDLVIEHDPTMTPERYERELAEWAGIRRAERKAGGDRD